eukprot:81329_1
MAEMIWVSQDDGSYKKIPNPNPTPKPKKQNQQNNNNMEMKMSTSNDPTHWSLSTKPPYGAAGLVARFPVLLNGSIIVCPHNSTYLYQFNISAQKWSKQKIFSGGKTYHSMCGCNNTKLLFIYCSKTVYVINSTTMKVVKKILLSFYGYPYFPAMI